MTRTRKPSDPPLTPEDRAAVARRAVDVATQIASGHGIAVSDPAVLAERYALRVHLRPTPLVARVSTFTALLRDPIAVWLQRELDVTRFLFAQGVPVVPPSSLLPAGPHLKDGFAVSFWSYEKPISDQLPSHEVVAPMLAELHRALREYPGDLPFLAPPLNDIPRGLARLQAMPDGLSAKDLVMLQQVADRLLPPLMQADLPIQPLHGDAHVYNLIPSERGLLWNDFEDTCRGPVEWDLCSLSDPASSVLASYDHPHSPEILNLLRQVRLLHATVWVLALLPEVDEFAAHARSMLDTIRTLA